MKWFWFGWRGMETLVFATTHTNDPVSPAKAAQPEIAPVLLCVREQQRYSTVFISTAFTPKLR